MSVWRHLTRGLRVLAHRSAADQDVADEVQHYLEQATAESVARGMSADDARRAARLEVGSVAGVRDQVRAGGWEMLIATLAGDLRLGARQLRRRPAFAATAILVLGLGVGATTAVFSAVYPVLFAPLPYPHPDRLVMVWERLGSGGRMASFATYRALADSSESFDALAVVKSWQPTRTGALEPERLEGQRVSADYFTVLGVRPAVGRDFRAADDVFHGPNVAILGHALWQRAFGADPAIVGRQVRLDDDLFIVIGVMPRGFENVLAPAAEIWAPLQYNPSLPVDGREWGHHLRLVGRLRRESSRNAARNELDAIAPALGRLSPAGYANSGNAPDGFIVNALQSDIVADVQPVLLAVLGAVGLVLLIACVNVSSLLLTRAAQRRSEFAMRAALGAPAFRLIRQQVTEALLLATLGGAVGLAAAVVGVRALVAVSPPELPRTAAIGVDGVAFTFATCLTTLVGLLISVVPALHTSRTDLQSSMQAGSPRSASGHQRARRALVVAEVALSLVLLVCAGLLLRSLDRVFAVRPGFDPSRVVTMQVQESARRFRTAAEKRTFFEQALDAVRRVPGVRTAAFTSQLPLSSDYDSYGVRFEQDGERGGGPALRYAVSPGYVETMRIPLRRGRMLDERDRADAPQAIVISESFAKRAFRDREPIGQRVRVGPDMNRPDRPWATVVGVVGDVKQSSLAAVDEDAFYVPVAQWPFPDTVLSLVVRAREVDAASLVPAIKQAVWSVDRNQPIVRVATMERVVSASEARRRFALILFEVFALAALVLAATGVYGVLAGAVVERTREIGVRAALGASRRDIVALVVGQGLSLTGIGVLIGLAGAVAATRSLATLLFGISSLDPVTYFTVAGLLAGVAVLASSLTARRAARIDPAVTLRAE